MPVKKPTDRQKETEIEVANALEKQGYSKDQIAGWIANFYQESSLNPDIEESPQIANGRKELGYGIAQWTNSKWSNRRDDLVKFAKDNELPLDSVDTQMKFIDYELNNTQQSIKKGLDRVFNSNPNISAEDAAIGIMDNFEKPNAAHANSEYRKERARDVKDRLYNNEGQMKKKFLKKPEKPLLDRFQDITAKRGELPPLVVDPSTVEAASDPKRVLASGNVSEEELRQIESANLKEAEKQVANAEELSEIKPEVDQSAQNLKENVPQGMSEYKPSNPDPENLQSDLKDALMYFAPQALGLALGNIFGGTKAALAGAEQAGKMRDAYSDFKMKQVEVAQKLNETRQDNQVLQDYSDDKGRPIVFHKVTRKFFDVDGNPLDTSKIRNLKQERSQQYAGLQERSLNIREGQAGQLSEQQQTYLKGMLSSKGSLDRISNFMGKVNTGIVANSFQNLMEKAGFASKDYIGMKQEVASLTNDYIKAVTGAQMSEPEAERISRALPSMDDPPEVFSIKVATLKNIIQGNEKAFDDSIRTGQPLKADTIAKIRKELDNYDSKVQSKGTAPASSLMSEAQRKRMEELKAKYRK